MQRKVTKAAIAAVLLTVVMAMAPARVGPPWISIEYPPSPYDRTTRDAFLLVHAFHHGTPMNFPVAGRAEGVVNGERKSVKLEFATTSRQGVYALRKQWPSEGNWVLAIDVTQEGNSKAGALVEIGASNSKAGALVEIGASGEVAKVTVPTRREDGWAIPRAITSAEIESALRTRGALASAAKP